MSYAAMAGAAQRNGSPDRQTLCRITDSLRAKATRALPEPERRPIASAQSFRWAFGRPWRQTEGLLRSLTTLLGMSVGVPDHTTFSRRSPDLALATALARAPARGPVHVVIDATGLKVYGAGEWLAEKHGARGKRTWRKLHLAIDPSTSEILASELTS